MKHSLAIRRALIATGIGVASIAGSVTPAHAGPGDAPNALVTNTLDSADGAVQLALAGCAMAVAGAPVAQHTPATPGIDAGSATVACESTTLQAYGLSVSVEIQYFTGTAWVTIGGTRNVANYAGAAGTSGGTVSTTGNYPTGSAALDKFHRAKGCVWTTLNTTPKCTTSLDVWYMAS